MRDTPAAKPTPMRQQLTNLQYALRPLAVFSLALLAGLGISRLGLVAWQFERVMSADMLGPVLLQGLRFDFVTLGFLLVWPVIALPVFSTSRLLLRIGRPLLIIYLLAGFALAIFLELATPSFINQFDARPNRLFIEYLAYPKEIGSTLIVGYGLQLIGVGITLLAAVGFLLHRLRRVTQDIQPVHAVLAVVATPMLLVLCVGAARSTLDHRAVNPSTVAISTDPMVNDLALNSIYTVLYALAEERSELQGGVRYAPMPEPEMIERVKTAMQIPSSQFIDERLPTLHEQQVDVPSTHPKNLVIILEESLGAEFVGALGGLPLTPRLDALARQGIWFEQLYATGTRSVRGLEALITGFTPTPARSVVKLGRSQRDFFTIAQLLRTQGYDTSFIYGGEAQFDNMRRFFMNNGFDLAIDENDYENPVFHGSWGVSDEDLLARADQEFSKPREHPFFSLVFTTSNHSPYEYPEGRFEPYEDDPHTVNNAVKYADYALGRFFDLARTRPYWNDTVFLVVADHNSRVYGAELVPIEHFHIPGLILGGGIEPGVYAPIASQIDMPPTLLALIGIASAHPMIGHDLSRPEFAEWPGRAILQYGSTQAYMLGDAVAILRRDLPPENYHYDGVSLRPAPPDSQLIATALAHANWTSTAYERHLYRMPDPVRAGLSPDITTASLKRN